MVTDNRSAPSPIAAPADATKTSYGQILRSSALIGGSQVLVIAIGIVRTKAMAVMLGPAGFGLWGLYNAVADLATSVAGMGVNGSGVRQIAEAAGSDEPGRIARTVAALRRTSVVLGLLGAALLVVLARPVSELTFGSDRYALGVALLGLAVAFRLVSAGQAALLQGLRRIRDLAATNALGALLGSAAAVGLVYALGEAGIAWSLVALAACTLFVTWLYARRVESGARDVPGAAARAEAVALLRLGVAFMMSGILMVGAAYAVRTMVLRLEGAEAAGFYQAAWTLGGLYIGIVLQAMGADFYPRLTGVIRDHATSNRLVNEQAQVSLLLAGPGIVATILLAPLVIVLFYSSQFAAADETLRWICLGMALRIITWPMGYIVLAKGDQRIFFLTELAWAVVNVSLSWACLHMFGLEGAGIAFFLSYVFHAALIFPVVRRMTGFGWTRTTAKIGICFVAVVASVFAASFVLPKWASIVIGVLGAFALGLVALVALARLVGPHALPTALRPLLERLRRSPRPERSA
jgi:PST family polysaccharide transporter